MHLSLHSLFVVFFCDFDHDIEDKYKWRFINMQTVENYSVINESKKNEHCEIKDDCSMMTLEYNTYMHCKYTLVPGMSNPTRTLFLCDTVKCSFK